MLAFLEIQSARAWHEAPSRAIVAQGPGCKSDALLKQITAAFSLGCIRPSKTVKVQTNQAKNIAKWSLNSPALSQLRTGRFILWPLPCLHRDYK